VTEALTWLGQLTWRWVRGVTPWTNVYGAARSLLALGTLLTLALNHSTMFFSPTGPDTIVPSCQGLRQLSFFCVFGPRLELARWVAVVILLVVAVGWRPRVTGPAHWWVSWSYFLSATIKTGGDQITANLALLLLPITLLDGRPWHWQRSESTSHQGGDEAKRLFALSALTVIRIQVAGVYLHSALAKFWVPEWANGTALWYWTTDPAFGVPNWLSPLVLPLMSSYLTLAIASYGTLALELALFGALFMPERWRGVMLILGIGLHSGIAITMGLVSFSIAMFAALVLYLRPPSQEFGLRVPSITMANSSMRRKLARFASDQGD
jgi:antimicrobial peptide system SdpB family protein